MLNIIAVDDHRIFLEGVSSLLAPITDFNLVDICQNRDELLALIDKYRPDVVLMDISMPGISIESVLQVMEKDYPDIQLLALTMHSELNLVSQLLHLGMSGYILKEDAFDELEQAIRNVAANEQYISCSLLEVMGEPLSSKKTLTQRESEILRLVGNGYSNKSVAKQLLISERTVRFHLSNCCIKLNANGRTNAVAKALSLSLFEM
jgi:DNA-binding NarL/FixJ family response regulator